MGSVRASLPSRAENFAGSSRSTPVVSVRPISKISASSMASPRLPLKVSPCRTSASPAAVGRPCRFSITAASTRIETQPGAPSPLGGEDVRP